MPDYPIWSILLLLLLLILNAFASAAETAVSEVYSTSLKKKEAEGNGRARYALRILNHRRRCTTVLDILRTVAIFGCGMIVAKAVSQYLLPRLKASLQKLRYGDVLAVVIVVMLLIAFLWLVELISIKIPKKMSFQHAEDFTLVNAKKILFFMWLLTPAAFLAEWLARGFVSLFSEGPVASPDNVTEEEIISIVNESHEQGLLEEEKVEMISKVMDFDDKEAKDIMTRRQRIVGVRDDMTPVEALGFCLSENFSRFPVYRETIDDIIGILHLKDLITYYMENKDNPTVLLNTPLSELVFEPFFVPETQSINILFKTMQQRKMHMAIVIDEYGQTAGLVAMEDMLEEIVGDIQDEYDEEELEFTEEAEGVFLVKGEMALYELSELLFVDFDDEAADTLSGFLVSRLDRIPSETEKEYPPVIDRGYSYEIVQVIEKRIELVRIKRIVSDSAEVAPSETLTAPSETLTAASDQALTAETQQS